jgi:methionyl-tRNA formyltransferase
MGTPDFSVAPLKALLDAGHDVLCVYSQPPRKAGRGQKLTPSPVHAFAEAQGIEVRTPASLKGTEEQDAFRALNADAAVVVAYGLILPQAILDATRLGCFNIHASLLPRWRGAAPIQRAIEAGDEKTGVAIMKMDAGLDTGPIILSEEVSIAPTTTASQLFEGLSTTGARLINEALNGVASGALTPTPQPAEGVTYAHKIDKGETHIDWTRDAARVSAQVRAFYPMAWCEMGRARVRVLELDVVDGDDVDGDGVAGVTLDDHLRVACGTGAVRLKRVQPAGKAAMDADAFLNGHPVPPGEPMT